jgi:uncharacterized coiled-coil protein SlyX
MTLGDAQELRKMADILEKMEGHAVQAYRQHSPLSEEEISALMAAETWMDGKEAKDKGFVEVLTDELEIAASVRPSQKLKVPAAAMKWVKAEETAAPAPATEEPAKTEESTGGTENGTETAPAPAGTEAPAKTDEEAKPEDVPATAGNTDGKDKGSEASGSALPPEVMAKLDAAYDEGQAAGYEKGVKEAGTSLKTENTELKASLASKEQEIAALKTAVAEKDQKISTYDSRLAKLGGGLGASGTAEDAAPATFEEAIKKYDWAIARKKFPVLYEAYRQAQKKNRK